MGSSTASAKKKKRRRVSTSNTVTVKAQFSGKETDNLLTKFNNLCDKFMSICGVGASNNDLVTDDSVDVDSKDDTDKKDIEKDSKEENDTVVIGSFYSVVTLEIARELLEFAEDAARECITIIALVQKAYDAILVARYGYPPCNLARARHDNKKMDNIRKRLEAFFEGRDKLYAAIARNYVIKLSDGFKGKNKIINDPSPWALERYNRKYGENNTLPTQSDVELNYSKDGYHTNFIAEGSEVKFKKYIPVDYAKDGKNVTSPIFFYGKDYNGRFIPGKSETDVLHYDHGFREYNN